MLKKLYYWFHRKISKPEEREEYSSGYWQDMVRTNALMLCRAIKGKVLEVGCGEGLFIKRLSLESQELKIFGADIRSEILLKAKRRLGGRINKDIFLTQADAGRLPFKSGLFDAVIAINVFFNLPGGDIFKKTMDEIMRVCKEGGKIIFDIRNSLNPFLLLKYKFAKYYDDTVKTLPLRTYRLNKIISYLEGRSFTISDKIHIGFPKNIFSPIIVVEVVKGRV